MKKNYYIMTFACLLFWSSNAIGQACTDPSALMAMEDCNKATLSWVSDINKISSTIQWGPQGFTPGSGNFIYQATSPYDLMGLSFDTDYDFWVLDSCTQGPSNWVGPFSFTTDSLPKALFNANQNATPSPDTVQYGFSALPSMNADYYWWDYGDGSPNDSGVFEIHNYTQNGTYTVMLVVTNACGVDTMTKDIVISEISIGENLSSSIKVYPNPSKGELHFSDLNELGSSVEIVLISSTGQKVYELYAKTDQSTNLHFDLSNLPDGMYSIQMNGNQKSITKQLIISK